MTRIQRYWQVVAICCVLLGSACIGLNRAYADNPNCNGTGSLCWVYRLISRANPGDTGVSVPTNAWIAFDGTTGGAPSHGCRYDGTALGCKGAQRVDGDLTVNGDAGISGNVSMSAGTVQVGAVKSPSVGGLPAGDGTSYWGAGTVMLEGSAPSLNFFTAGATGLADSGYEFYENLSGVLEVNLVDKNNTAGMVQTECQFDFTGNGHPAFACTPAIWTSSALQSGGVYVSVNAGGAVGEKTWYLQQQVNGGIGSMRLMTLNDVQNAESLVQEWRQNGVTPTGSTVAAGFTVSAAGANGFPATFGKSLFTVDGTNGNVWSGSDAGIAGYLTAADLVPARRTLDTCAVGFEGAIEQDILAGANLAHVTRICACTSNGSNTYAWVNVLSHTTGNTTTCPD